MCNPSAWLISTLGLFLLPLFLLGATFSHIIPELVTEHGPHLVAFGITLIAIYWGISALALGLHPIITQRTNA